LEGQRPNRSDLAGGKNRSSRLEEGRKLVAVKSIEVDGSESFGRHSVNVAGNRRLNLRSAPGVADPDGGSELLFTMVARYAVTSHAGPPAEDRGR
jgi:hypothetical protein